MGGWPGVVVMNGLALSDARGGVVINALIQSGCAWCVKFKAPQRNVTIALLLLILAAAFVLRGMQAWFGMPYLHYWDEPQTAYTALNIIKSGDPNPHFFRYGSLLIYACVL